MRTCQRQCLIKMITVETPGIYNFQLYCGSGKTRIMAKFIQLAPKQRFLILVPKLLLLYQLSKVFTEQGIAHELQGSDNNEIKKTSRVIISVYNSIEYVINNQYDYVFIDEAHKIYVPDIFNIVLKGIKITGGSTNEDDVEPNYVDLIQHSMKTAFCFNFSATLNQSQLLYKYSLNQAVRDKVIVDYKLTIALYDTDKKNFYQNYIKCRKCLVYCNTIESCKKISTLIGCQYLDGKMPNEQRQQIMKNFQDEQKYLVSCRTLCEGIDLPFIDCCIFEEERNSQVNIIQCIGRAQRLYQGKTIANIYIPVQTKKKNVFDQNLKDRIYKYCKILYEYDEKVKNKLKVEVYGKDQHEKQQQIQSYIYDTANSHFEV